MEKHEKRWRKLVMPEFITAYFKKFSYSVKMHTCYKWLHRLPSNICCGAKQSCPQTTISSLLKQLEGISDSTARCMHFITLRMTTTFEALKSPSKMRVLQYRKSTSCIHPIQSNPTSYLLLKIHFFLSSGIYSVCMMEENRLLCFLRLKLHVISFLICPWQPKHPSVQHSVEGT